MTGLNSKFQNGAIVLTDHSCLITRTSGRGPPVIIPCPDIPTLVWSDGIDVPASDWMRHLVADGKTASSSAEESLKTLRQFLRFCRDRRRPWEQVDDAFIELYLAFQRQKRKIGVRRINHHVSTIFAFYLWAERSRRLRYHVGIYSQDDLPPHLKGLPPAIAAEKRFSKGKVGRVYSSWHSPLTVAGAKQSLPRHTPTEEEVRQTHRVTLPLKNAVRNSLLYSWGEETGARRAEALAIRVDQIPSYEMIGDAILHDRPIKVDIVRKGNKQGELLALPLLAQATRDYIDNERSEIVSRFKLRHVEYIEPDEVFLSSTTGQVLTKNSLTRISIEALRNAGVSRSSYHQFRHKKAKDSIRVLLEENRNAVTGESLRSEELIGSMVADMMGHKSSRSLMPYIREYLDQETKHSDSFKGHTLAANIRQMERIAAALEKRNSTNRKRTEINKLIDSLDEDSVSSVLEGVLALIKKHSGV